MGTTVNSSTGFGKNIGGGILNNMTTLDRIYEVKSPGELTLDMVN